MKTYVTKQSKQVTFQEAIESFHKEINQSTKEICALQVGISDYSHTFLNGSLHDQEGHSIWAIANAHYVCLHAKNYTYPPVDENETSLNIISDGAKSMIAALGAVQSKDEEIQENPIVDVNSVPFEKYLLLILRTRASNSILQLEFTNEIASIAILFGLKEFENLSIIEDTDFYSKFESKIGIHPKEYLYLLLSIWSISNTNICIDLKVFLENSKKRSEIQTSLDNLLNDITIFPPLNKHDFKFNFLAPLKDSDKAVSLFTRYPLISLSQKHLLITSSHFLESLLLSKLMNKIRIISDSINDPALNSTLSSRFEDYIYELFKSSGFEPFREYHYQRNNSNKSSDLIIFEKHGSEETCILIQVKLKLANDDILMPTEISTAKAGLEKYYDFIERSLSFYKNLSLLQEANFNQDNIELSRRILNSKKVFMLGIAPQVHDLFCSSVPRSILKKEINKKFNDPNFLDSFIRTKNENKELYWHIMGVSDLITFLAQPDCHKKLFYNLRRYLKSEDVDNIDIRPDRTLPSNFKSFLIEKYHRSKMKKAFQPIQAISTSLFDEMAEYLNLYK